jgi:hypothetical protein
MEVRAPEAGLPIDRDMVLVLTLHKVLVSIHKASLVMVRFIIDSQRMNGVNGHYEAEYELPGGGVLRLYCKQTNDDMMFRVTRGKSQLNYSVKLSKYVDDDLMPISQRDCEDLVSHWLRD